MFGAARSAPSNTRFARMDAQQLALPDAQFDVVLCQQVGDGGEQAGTVTCHHG